MVEVSDTVNKQNGNIQIEKGTDLFAVNIMDRILTLMNFANFAITLIL